MRFFDSSALVKLYIEEIGTELIKDYYRTEEFLISEITKIEMLSVFGRLFKGGLIDEKTYFNLVQNFEFDIKNRFYFLEIYKSIKLTKIASEIIADLNMPNVLRTLDSLQLASAIIYREFFSNIIFVSSDRKLNSVAKTKGFLIENPEEI